MHAGSREPPRPLSDNPNAHSLGFSVMSCSVQRSNSARTLSTCWSKLSSNTFSTLLRPAMAMSPACSIRLPWMIGPWGFRKKRYRPHGVRNVVNSSDSCDNAICQYPWVASKVEKYLDSGFMLETASLGVFIGWIGRRTNVLSFVRSTQRRTPPLYFGTTTRGWHHLVGNLPMASRFLVSSFGQDFP